MLELSLLMAILLFVVSVFYRMLAAGHDMQEINRENAIATEAARVVVERMRDESFAALFSLYDEAPEDDPGGVGTAPGHRFAVPGLRPLDTAADGLHGEVVLPALMAVPAGQEAPGEMQALGAPPPQPVLQLREDVDVPELGMPRDLNGDSIVDDGDHARDYVLLPVQVRVSWQGKHGPRSIELFTMLADYEVGK